MQNKILNYNIKRLGINEISKKKSITPLIKVILILHFNKMNNELQTPTSSFYFWRILSVCLWSNQKKRSNYNKKKFIYYYHLTKDFK